MFARARLFFLATALSLGSHAAVAQAPPLAVPTLTPAAPAAPISEAQLAAARDVVTGSGLARTFEGIIPQIADQIRNGFSRQRPELIRDMEEALKTISAELARQPDRMVDVAARFYAGLMSEQELKDAAAFFKSPAGQKYVNSQGQILNQLFSEMQVFSQTLGNVMMDRLREELRKKGHTL